MVTGDVPESRSVATRARIVLLAPLGVSLAIGACVLAANALSRSGPLQPIDPGWTLLLLLGPSIPVYLLLLPLFPFVLRALRRGWAPSRSSVLGCTLLVSLAVDLLLWLGRS